MSTDLTPVETGEIVATLAESESTIKALQRRALAAERKAVETVESSRAEIQRCHDETGAELVVIKSAGSYKDKGYRSLSAYMKDAPKNLGMSEQHAWRLMRAFGITNPNENGLAEIANERQSREIARVPEPLREQVVVETIQVEGKLTGRAIRETFERIENPPTGPDGSLLVAVASACSAALADGWTEGEIYQVVADALGGVVA